MHQYKHKSKGRVTARCRDVADLRSASRAVMKLSCCVQSSITVFYLRWYKIKVIECKLCFCPPSFKTQFNCRSSPALWTLQLSNHSLKAADTSLVNNYRPISNLQFLSKIVVKAEHFFCHKYQFWCSTTSQHRLTLTCLDFCVSGPVLLVGSELQDREAKRGGSCRRCSEPGGQNVRESGEKRLSVSSGAEGTGEPPLSEPQVPGGCCLLQQSHSKDRWWGACVPVSVCNCMFNFMFKKCFSF